MSSRVGEGPNKGPKIRKLHQLRILAIVFFLLYSHYLFKTRSATTRFMSFLQWVYEESMELMSTKAS
jgi:hypothetical protein